MMTMASVFSGIGGEMVAAAMMGWDVKFFCEKNPFGHKVLSHWFDKAEKYEDITTTDFSKWRGKIDVLTGGGFPCQPFSYAGKRRGADDDRYLWPFMFRCIDQVRPTWVVAENVGGIQTMVEPGTTARMAGEANLFAEDNGVPRYQYRGTFTLQRICKDLETHGYSVQPVLIPACAVGAPHRRDRVFIVAHRNANYADSGTDGRESGVVQVSKEQEQVQERNDVQQSGKPGEVRPEGSRENPSANAPCGGEGTSRQGERPIGDGCDENQQQSQRRAETERTNGRSAFLRDTADTECMRLQHDLERGSEAAMSRETSEGRQDCLSEQVQCVETDGRGRVAADTDERENTKDGADADCYLYRLERLLQRAQHEDAQWQRQIAQDITDHIRSVSPDRGRWETFPTVSPVHRGNDGLPFSLDDLTLPPTKWRIESLKAYGNAIVPQVMYEIFRAIEITEMS